jgi:hypothetical protein
MVEAHQVECEVFAAAYRADPASVLTVQEEHARWAASGRREERAAAHAVSVADTDARRAVMADRFKTVDLLED